MLADKLLHKSVHSYVADDTVGWKGGSPQRPVIRGFWTPLSGFDGLVFGISGALHGERCNYPDPTASSDSPYWMKER